MDILERLRFDASRCEATFSKGVAGNIEEAATEIEQLRAECQRLSECLYNSNGEVNRLKVLLSR
jgi:hypothetical protein